MPGVESRRRGAIDDVSVVRPSAGDGVAGRGPVPRGGVRHVALLIGTSGAYARALLRGIARFNRERGGWLTYHWPHGLHEELPKWLKGWQGQGVIARVG